MKDGNWFDEVYFGHKEGERKSNYPFVGGYKDNTGAPKQFAQWARAQIEKEDPKILEVGCAMGSSVREMLALGCDAYGIDVSQYILSLAEEDVKGRLFRADMRYLGRSRIVRHAPFDLIVSKDVLEHATEDAIEKILVGFSRFAPKQAHIVNTGEFPYQAAEGDASHFLIKPLVWWQELSERLGLDITWKHT